MSQKAAKQPWTPKKFKTWSLGFTAAVLKLITLIWGFCMIYAAVIMTLALYHTGEFSYLDTYITKVCDCFSAAVITGLITRTIGNVFEFNNGSIFGTSINSIKEEENNDSSSSDVSADSMCGDDVSNYRSD